jgi:hypothetical protein
VRIAGLLSMPQAREFMSGGGTGVHCDKYAATGKFVIRPISQPGVIPGLRAVEISPLSQPCVAPALFTYRPRMASGHRASVRHVRSLRHLPARHTIFYHEQRPTGVGG